MKKFDNIINFIKPYIHPKLKNYIKSIIQIITNAKSLPYFFLAIFNKTNVFLIFKNRSIFLKKIHIVGIILLYIMNK